MIFEHFLLQVSLMFEKPATRAFTSKLAHWAQDTLCFCASRAFLIEACY